MTANLKHIALEYASALLISLMLFINAVKLVHLLHPHHFPVYLVQAVTDKRDDIHNGTVQHRGCFICEFNFVSEGFNFFADVTIRPPSVSYFDQFIIITKAFISSPSTSIHADRGPPALSV